MDVIKRRCKERSFRCNVRVLKKGIARSCCLRLNVFAGGTITFAEWNRSGSVKGICQVQNGFRRRIDWSCASRMTNREFTRDKWCFFFLFSFLMKLTCSSTEYVSSPSSYRTNHLLCHLWKIKGNYQRMFCWIMNNENIGYIFCSREI